MTAVAFEACLPARCYKAMDRPSINDIPSTLRLQQRRVDAATVFGVGWQCAVNIKDDSMYDDLDQGLECLFFRTTNENVDTISSDHVLLAL